MEQSGAKRAPNWSVDELDALSRSVSENIALIRGKFSMSLTKASKQNCWLIITERVNAVNTTGRVRTTQDVRKKWQDISSLTKKKEAARIIKAKQTGGGPQELDTLTSWEKIIVGTFTKSALEGVTGGVDTSNNRETSSNTFKSTSTDSDKSLPQENTDGASSSGNLETSIDSELSKGACFKENEESNFLSKKSKKRRLSSDDSIQGKFLMVEEEKEKNLKEYRGKKLALLNQTIEQQKELLHLQRRATIALESIAAKMDSQPIINLENPIYPFQDMLQPPVED